MAPAALLAALAAAALAALAALHPSLTKVAEVATGYGAKLGCSFVFVSGRSLQSALDAEFVFPPIGLAVTFEVHRERRCVSAAARFSSTSRTACWRSERLGCSLDAAPSLEPRLAPRSVTPGPWPLGSDPVDPARARAADVDWNAVERLVGAHFDDTRLHARALLIVHRGELVLERYGDGVNATTPLLGWSASKSVVNALLGRLVHQGRLPEGLESVIDLEEWRDGRRELTLREALQMRDGLDFDEWYEPLFDVTDMLFRQRAAFMPTRGQRASAQEPRCFQYSSHTTNSLCRWMRHRLFSSQEAYDKFPTEALFDPLWADSFVFEQDPSAVFVGSSFAWANPRDWAKLGLLYLMDGVWVTGTRLLPHGWVNFSSSPSPTSGGVYGGHFWLSSPEPSSEEGGGLDGAGSRRRCDALYPSRRSPPRDWLRAAFPHGSFAMCGFEEQLVAVVPSKEVVLVRLGATKEVVLSWERPEFYSALLSEFPDAVE